MDRKVIIGIIILMVAVGNIACNRLQDKEEPQEPEVVQETPQETPKEKPKKTPQVLDSPVSYEMADEMKSMLDMVAFDKAFVNFLKNNMEYPTGRDGEMGYVVAKNDGWLSRNYEDGSLMFRLQLQTQEREVIICVVKDGRYEFALEE